MLSSKEIMKRINRRQSIFQVNADECERQKTMEKALSNDIDNSLRVLQFFHPFNDALQAIFAKVRCIHPTGARFFFFFRFAHISICLMIEFDIRTYF